MFCLFLTFGFCPKNLAVARKVMALPDSRGCSPGSYAYQSVTSCLFPPNCNIVKGIQTYTNNV